MPGRYLGDQEIDDDLALGRQQRAEPGLPRAQLADIGRDQAVEEVAGVLAGDLDHAPIRKKGCFHSQNWLFFQVPLGNAPSADIPCQAKALDCTEQGPRDSEKRAAEDR
jgi:hypothetical protein